MDGWEGCPEKGRGGGPDDVEETSDTIHQLFTGETKPPLLIQFADFIEKI